MNNQPNLYHVTYVGHHDHVFLAEVMAFDRGQAMRNTFELFPYAQRITRCSLTPEWEESV